MAGWSVGPQRARTTARPQLLGNPPGPTDQARVGLRCGFWGRAVEKKTTLSALHYYEASALPNRRIS